MVVYEVDYNSRMPYLSNYSTIVFGRKDCYCYRMIVCMCCNQLKIIRKIISRRQMSLMLRICWHLVRGGNGYSNKLLWFAWQSDAPSKPKYWHCL